MHIFLVRTSDYFLTILSLYEFQSLDYIIRHPLEPEFLPKFQVKRHMLSVKKWNLTGLRVCVRMCMRACARACVGMPRSHVRACACGKQNTWIFILIRHQTLSASAALHEKERRVLANAQTNPNPAYRKNKEPGKTARRRRPVRSPPND